MTNKKTNKALVTGGLGFIGSHLVECLLDKGIESIIIDNKVTNVVNEGFFDKQKCQIIPSSIQETDLNNIDDVDTVYHLASIVGPSGVLNYAGEMGLSMVNDSVKLRDYCIEKEVPLIDISTSEVYGHTRTLDEESEKIFPGIYKVRTEYGAGKMLAEMAVVNKARVENRLTYHIIRPFNVTGERQSPQGGFVLPRFVISALTDQPITIFGDGEQKRAFTHVRDICEAVLDIRDSDNRNEIWNIGNPENEMTINYMAKRVIDLVKEKYPDKDPQKIYVDGKKIHGPLFEEAVEKVPFIRKIQTKVGWEPKRSSDQIFREVMDFYDNKITNEGYYFKTS
jgi:nucleoside-diphosphate-sugar epimerase